MTPNVVAAYGLLSPAPTLPRRGRPSKNGQRIKVGNEFFDRDSDQQLSSWRETPDTMVDDGSSRCATLPTPVFTPRPSRRIPVSYYFDPRHDITSMPKHLSSRYVNKLVSVYYNVTDLYTAVLLMSLNCDIEFIDIIVVRPHSKVLLS